MLYCLRRPCGVSDRPSAPLNSTCLSMLCAAYLRLMAKVTSLFPSLLRASRGRNSRKALFSADKRGESPRHSRVSFAALTRLFPDLLFLPALSMDHVPSRLRLAGAAPSSHRFVLTSASASADPFDRASDQFRPFYRWRSPSKKVRQA